MSGQAKRYRAFISYSQKDKAYARRLHAALESYRLPSGVEAEGLDAKRKLGRLFRDDDEMGAATDLGAALQGAIADAESLIVICSPNAARSQWVNEEILHFKRTGRADRIFAVIVAGEPTPPPQRADRECFPPALRFELGPDGALSDRPAEPLGLDVRKEPFNRLVVRLAAGLLGIAFDTLWRREQRRARAQTTMRVGVAAAVLAVGAALAYGWFSERLARDLREARAEFAEGRLTEGLRRLQPYVGGPLHAQVAPTLQTVLGWAGRPVAEQVAPTPANEDDFIPHGGYGGSDYRDRYGAEVWRSLPNPRGMAPDSTTFDAVGGELIKYFMFIANSGIVWFACTDGDGGAQCLQLGAPHVDELEYGGPLYEDVRSPDGRHLSLGRAGAMLDLQTRSIVNPAGDLPIGDDLAYDFSPDGAQFLIASAGQITAYRPNGAGGAWAPSGVVATLPSDSDGEQSSLAGLLALGGDRFIVAQRDGRLHRIGFGERTTWQTALRDVGGIRYSSDRRRFAIVAANGVQVFESATGLPMSGVMLPTDWEDFPVSMCFFYVHVGDDGALRVLCPVAGGAMGWTPTRFNGDIAQRLQGILCGDGAAPLEALRRCAATRR